MKGQKGFSLIELAVVMVIMGLLVSFGVPQYQNMQKKAQRSQARTLLSSMYTSQKAFFTQWNQYYGDFNAVGYGLEGDIGYYVGFSNGGTGPSGHPNAAYRRRASVTRLNQICDAAPGGRRTCNYGSTKTTYVDRSASVVNTNTSNTFVFSAAANLDSDSTLDVFTINQNRQILQPAGRDDIAQ